MRSICYSFDSVGFVFVIDYGFEGNWTGWLFLERVGIVLARGKRGRRIFGFGLASLSDWYEVRGCRHLAGTITVEAKLGFVLQWVVGVADGLRALMRPLALIEA